MSTEQYEYDDEYIFADYSDSDIDSGWFGSDSDNDSFDEDEIEELTEDVAKKIGGDGKGKKTYHYNNLWTISDVVLNENVKYIVENEEYVARKRRAYKFRNCVLNENLKYFSGARVYIFINCIFEANVLQYVRGAATYKFKGTIQMDSNNDFSNFTGASFYEFSWLKGKKENFEFMKYCTGAKQYSFDGVRLTSERIEMMRGAKRCFFEAMDASYTHENIRHLMDIGCDYYMLYYGSYEQAGLPIRTIKDIETGKIKSMYGDHTLRDHLIKNISECRKDIDVEYSSVMDDAYIEVTKVK